MTTENTFKIKPYIGKNLGVMSIFLSMEGFKDSIYSVIRTVSNRTAIKTLKTIKKSFDLIDDYVDIGYKPEILGLNSLCVDNKPSELLQHILLKTNETYNDNKYLERFKLLLDKNDDLANGLVRFGNILSAHLQSKLVDKAANNRDAAAQKHCEITGINMALYSYVIKHFNNCAPDTKDLTIDSIKKNLSKSLFAWL